MVRWLRSRNASERLSDWRRSIFLLIFGLLHIRIAVVLLGLPEGTPIPTLAPVADFGVTPQMAVVPWVASGVVAVVMAFVPPGRDSLGFRALAGVEAAWALLNFIGAATDVNPMGLASGFTYLGFGVAVTLVSGMVSASAVSREATRMLDTLLGDDD